MKGNTGLAEKISAGASHLSKTKLVYEDFGTEIASLGACYDLIRIDWGYTLDN